MDDLRFHILTVEHGSTSEKILAINVTNMVYDAVKLKEIIAWAAKEHPQLLPVYFRVSVDNDNHVYISPITKSSVTAALPDVYISSENYERYAPVLGSLADLY